MASLLDMTLALLSLFFFASSQGRMIFGAPPLAGINRFPELSAESDPEAAGTLLLPSEKPQTVSTTALDGEPVDSDAKITRQPLPASDPDAIATVPLTLINFHSINRFPRPCGRHHHYRFRPRTTTQLSVFRYGNGMILPHKKSFLHLHYPYVILDKTDIWSAGGEPKETSASS